MAGLQGDLAGAAAVVTGGGSGIGRGISEALADAGVSVAVADIDLAAAEETAGAVGGRGVRSLAVECDVTDPEDVRELADAAWAAFDRVDLVCNNAGVVAPVAMLDATLDDLRWVFDVNTVGPFLGMVEFGRRFVAQGTPSRIVSTGSEHSLGVPHALNGPYTASKHAVLALSDVLRREVPDHVGVSVLCPGLVRTRLWEAERNRPLETGPSAPESDEDSIGRRLFDEGMDPAEVGRRTVEGIQRGDFLIVTHAHSRRFAEERCQEVLGAFDARELPGDDGRWDIEAIVNRLISE
jgi:NAD(P)-dependent dehydrogenase (short-subunit alcohol dehydrogenase family)